MGHGGTFVSGFHALSLSIARPEIVTRRRASASPGRGRCVSRRRRTTRRLLVPMVGSTAQPCR
ncbi:hypothetical protein L083_2939 [Actinoplanes sp. N902-109]|nr:hypothetical protein L083_2939 [Actinoplanes sp. N902-109]